MEPTGVQRCALRLGSQDGVNKLVRVVEDKHMCTHCGEAVWVAEGAEVAHVCDPAAVARTQALDATIASLARVREGLEEARAPALQCAQMARASAC